MTTLIAAVHIAAVKAAHAAAPHTTVQWTTLAWIVGTVVVASGGVNVPSINTRTIETQVVLNDGQTVVLGGILDTTHSLQSTAVPWLGEIPVLGNLFKQTSKIENKDELLIFVTPKIVREGVSVN